MNFVDPDGRTPLLAAAIVVGAGVVGGVTAGTVAAFQGADLAEIGQAAYVGGAGAAVGAVGAMSGLVTAAVAVPLGLTASVALGTDVFDKQGFRDYVNGIATFKKKQQNQCPNGQ